MSNLIQPVPSITTPASAARRPLHISHSPSFVNNTTPAPSQGSRLSTPSIMNPPIDMKSNNLLNPTTTTTTTTTTTSTPTGTNNTSNDSKGNNTNSTGKTQVVFIHKLYDMLHDDSISHLIWWSPSLDSFYVTPGEEFSRALAQYFKHTNIASFIRQLNMYGFHKVNETFLNQEDQQQQQQQQSNRWEFRHSTNQFRKGDTESLKHIKRRSSKTLNSQKEIVNIKSLPPTSQPTDYAYSYQSEEANHYFAHHHSITSIHSPADNRPRSPSTPIPQQQYQPQQPQLLPPQQQQQYNGQPQVSMQQSPQEYIARPSIPAHPSYENATNFKLLELTNQINLLRNDFFHMNTRYETLQNELKCQIADSISVLDIVEGLSKNDNRMISDVRNLKNLINQRIQRINMIPIHQAPPPPPPPVQQQQPLQPLQLQVPQPGPPPPVPQKQQQQQQQHASISSSYHLDSASSSRNPSTVSAAPQSYPLNPHYSIYSNNSDSNNGFFRKREDSNNSKRNLSVYDPLQPVPSRHNSRILIEEQSSNSVGQQQLQHPAFRSRAESTYSPLSNVGKSNNQQQPAKPPTPINPPRIKTPVSEVKKQQQQQQQQVQAPPPPPPPPSTKQPVVPPVVQQKPSQVQTSRTNSLPNPITDHLAPQSPYFIQRNSFTSIYEHQKSLRIPSPRFNTTTPPRSVPENKESLSSMAKETKETVVSTSALPSVSELDKSIRSLVSLPPIIQHKDEREGNSNYNNDDNDTNKRRKLE